MNEDPLQQSDLAQASRWLAQRDRGFTTLEAEDFAAWLEQNPRRRELIASLEGSWNALDALSVLADSPGVRADPDLLAGQQRRRFRPAFVPALTALAAAAALALAAGLFLFRRSGSPIATSPVSSVKTLDAQRIELPDGSVAELNKDSLIDVHFGPDARRVRLLTGEARFTVAKNPNQPFLVDAHGVVVRALGTVFNVCLQPGAVEVVVTEGKVKVGRSSDAAPDGSATPEVPLLVAGQRALVPMTPGDAPATVEDLSHQRMEQLLAWQDPRLEFSGLRLAEVAEQFNRYNRHQLVMADDATGTIRVGGSFRANQVDAFVRLLQASFGVSAQEDGNRIVLRKSAQ